MISPEIVSAAFHQRLPKFFSFFSWHDMLPPPIFEKTNAEFWNFYIKFLQILKFQL